MTEQTNETPYEGQGGSYIKLPDGSVTPNLEDEAMRERAANVSGSKGGE